MTQLAEPIQATDPPDPSTPIARFDAVSKSFGRLKVLDRLSMSFGRGQITVIIGPSGTGKSVLLKHLVGLLEPDSGKVFFDEQRVDVLGESEMVSLRKRIGFCFQLGALFDSMNVLDNVAFPLVEHTTLSPAERAEKVSEALRMVLLPGIEKKMPGNLSGGQRKRVALARAIVLRPDLVLYDEPTTGLDPIRTDVVDELILTLNKRLGISSIVVTHDIKSATKIADRMVLLYDGRIEADGEPEAFCNSDNPLVRQFMMGQANDDELMSIREGFQAGPHLA